MSQILRTRTYKIQINGITERHLTVQFYETLDTDLNLEYKIKNMNEIRNIYKILAFDHEDKIIQCEKKDLNFDD